MRASFFERLQSLRQQKKTRGELDEHYKKLDLEKGDLPAMMLAGCITTIPILVLIGLVMLGILKLFGAL